MIAVESRVSDRKASKLARRVVLISEPLNKHIDELEETYRNVIIRYAQWPKD